MTALRIWTARLAHHKVPGYTGPGGLNVTRGSGGAYGGAFGPSRQLLDEANRRKLAAKRDEARLEEVWAWYVPLYVAEMRISYREHRLKWELLLARRDEPTLLCYCGTARRCHRGVLARLLINAGAAANPRVDVEYAGERELAT